jgi:hypothetical protein
VQEVRWDKRAQKKQGIIIFNMGKAMKIIRWELDLLYNKE